MAAWIDENGFAYDEIYAGRGKPTANAYIDDRAISCRPQEHGPPAFLAAENLARVLCDTPTKSTEAEWQLTELAQVWQQLTPRQRTEVLDQARGLGR